VKHVKIKFQDLVKHSITGIDINFWTNLSHRTSNS